jgi:hypothetical protein
MRFLLLCVLILFISCSVEPPEEFVSDNIYRIDCKTPIGEVKTYYISEGEYMYCYHWQSGIFDFKDLRGIQIKSSFCHVEGIPVSISVDKSNEELNCIR